MVLGVWSNVRVGANMFEKVLDSKFLQMDPPWTWKVSTWKVSGSDWNTIQAVLGMNQTGNNIILGEVEGRVWETVFFLLTQDPGSNKPPLHQQGLTL